MEDAEKKFVETATECPYCGSEEFYYEDHPEEGDIGLTELKVIFDCHGCGEKWIAIYKLSYISGIE